MTHVDTVDPRCLAANEALAAGDDAAMARHAEDCRACAFLVTLVPDLRQTLGTTGIGGAFEAILDRAISTGEMLLSRYRIERIIARGGQGIVCRATDREFGTVAIKILRCNPTSREDPLPEGRVALKLVGEGVCRIFNIERHGDIRLVVMELIDGECLQEALPRLTQALRLAIFRRVCEAVGRVHKQGILHLDLKPGNIVLRDGNEPVVTDFGIAVALDPDGSASPLGHTRGFAPPEQCAGERVDRRADVYALGTILKQLVTVPSSHVRRVIARATHPRPGERHADAAALLAELDRPTRVRRSLRRSLVIVVPSIGLLGGTVVALSMARRGEPAPADTTLVDFDGVETYGQPDGHVEASAYLNRLGIKVVVSPKTTLVIANTLSFYSGQALVPVSAPNVLTQVGSNDPVNFTLTFARPVAKLAFRRPALVPATTSGITFPSWTAIARDLAGNELARAGEAAFGSYRHVPAKDVVLDGPCIDSVRFESDNGQFAAFSAVIIDDLLLTYAQDDCAH